jgi:hypothetical protein
MGLQNASNLKELYCYVCKGTGKMYLEHADGTLSEQTCTYCRGAKNSVWIKNRFDAKQLGYDLVKLGIAAYMIVLGLTFKLPVWARTSGAKWFHFVLIAILAVGLVWMYLHPSPSKRRQKRLAKGPNPLTTDREKLIAGAVVAGAVVKHEWQKHERKLDRIVAQQDQIIRNQPKPPPYWQPPR